MFGQIGLTDPQYIGVCRATLGSRGNEYGLQTFLLFQRRRRSLILAQRLARSENACDPKVVPTLRYQQLNAEGVR
jgi:hypothetical protein